RRQCRSYAEKYVNIQSEEFQRLGVFGEWDRPYLTMDYKYEAVIARELGRVALSGAMFQSPKPVLWCGACRTALAEAEVEYDSHTSPSIFVAFPLESSPQTLAPELLGEQVFLVIWTTTPWTIPSNMAIAYNPEFKYGAYKTTCGRVLILAEQLAEQVLAKFGLSAEKIVVINNKNLQGLMARHPFLERQSKILPAMYVTLEQGTGLVHTAPGHGREDYETGLAHGLETFSPLDASARFTSDVPNWAGQNVLAANPAIIEHLRECGALLAVEQIDHQYPHCWRCKKPLIFRSTPQWFISMDNTGLRAKALKAIDEVRWVPAWGRERIYGMIENRPDWCISRQRSWGVPITVFLCQDCGQWHYSQAIMDHLFKLVSQEGADVWFDLPVSDLLPPGEKCAKCQGQNFEKETDILDVWFDSGSSFADTLEGRDYLPDMADMYLEGSDQHRGWFHSSLLISMANRGRAPYREVLTHGYVVDGQGRKMSKTEGNTIAPNDVIKKYGADILRLWVAAENYQDDIRISQAIVDMLAKAYFNFRNSARFILGNLADFDFKTHGVPINEMGEIDRFILAQLNTLVAKVRKAYDDYEFHAIYHLINNFVVELSAFYHDVIKDRLYTLSANNPKRRSTQTAMYEILSTITRLMAPVLSFTCEEIWDHLPGEKPESVFLTDLPQVVAAYENEELCQRWSALMKVRATVNRELEEARRHKIIGAPLNAQVHLGAYGQTLELLRLYEEQLPEIFIVSSVILSENLDLKAEGAAQCVASITPSPDLKCPRCWVHAPEVKKDADDNFSLCHKCQNP
ncbi:MAG: isoleucine--tRNA ligase, partial [Candidatus Adiutrix sp.]